MQQSKNVTKQKCDKAKILQSKNATKQKCDKAKNVKVTCARDLYYYLHKWTQRIRSDSCTEVLHFEFPYKPLYSDKGRENRG